MVETFFSAVPPSAAVPWVLWLSQSPVSLSSQWSVCTPVNQVHIYLKKSKKALKVIIKMRIVQKNGGVGKMACSSQAYGGDYDPYCNKEAFACFELE